MPIRHPALVALLALLSIFRTPAMADEIEISGAWVRTPPPGSRVTAGFARIINNGERDDALVGVSSRFASDISLHATTSESGMSGMRRMAHFSMPGGSAIELAPGDKHIMLHHLHLDELTPRKTVRLKFHFQFAAPQEVEAELRTAAAPTHANH